MAVAAAIVGMTAKVEMAAEAPRGVVGRMAAEAAQAAKAAEVAAEAPVTSVEW